MAGEGNMSRFLILMYHMVTEPRSAEERKYACPPQRFASHMSYLRLQNIEVVGLDSIRRHLEQGEPLPSGAVAVTLDDGFRDNYENAFQVLQQYRIPATIFLVSGAIGGANRWAEARGLPRRELMEWRHVREMAGGGVSFGSHTVTHPRLNELGDDEALREMVESRDSIQQQLGVPVDTFAYPFGLFGERTPALAREAGFALACSTRPGFNRAGIDPFALRRIEVFGTDVPWQIGQKITYGTNEAGLTLPLRYYWRRLRERLPHP